MCVERNGTAFKIGGNMIEKATTNTYKVTQSTEIHYDLKERKQFAEALKKDKERKLAEASQLQDQITAIEAEIREAEAVGVVETTGEEQK